MKRKLRLNSETLKVLSRSQAKQVAGGSDQTACVSCACNHTENDTCAGTTSTDDTWFWCGQCEETCDGCGLSVASECWPACESYWYHTVCDCN